MQKIILLVALVVSASAANAKWYTLTNYPTDNPKNWTWQFFYDDGVVKNQYDPKVLRKVYGWKRMPTDLNSNLNHVFWNIPSNKNHPNWKVRKYYRDPKIFNSEYKAAKTWLNDKRFQSYNLIVRISKSEQVMRVYHRPCWEAKTCKGLVYKWKVSTGKKSDDGGVETPPGFFTLDRRVAHSSKLKVLGEVAPTVYVPVVRPKKEDDEIIVNPENAPVADSDIGENTVARLAQPELIKANSQEIIENVPATDDAETTVAESPELIPLPVRRPKTKKIRVKHQMAGRSFSSRHVSRSIYDKQGIVAPMPWAVFFNGGIATHATPYIARLGQPASHGCIRMEEFRARELFHLIGQSGWGQVQRLERSTGKPLDETVSSYKTMIIVEPGKWIPPKPKKKRYRERPTRSRRRTERTYRGRRRSNSGWPHNVWGN